MIKLRAKPRVVSHHGVFLSRGSLKTPVEGPDLEHFAGRELTNSTTLRVRG